MRHCPCRCADLCQRGALMCRTHWQTVHPKKQKELYVQWLRWQRGEITEAKFTRLAIDSLNTADTLAVRRCGIEVVR